MVLRPRLNGRIQAAAIRRAARNSQYGALFGGVWGLSPHLPKTDEGLGRSPQRPGVGLGAKPLSTRKFCIFLQK